MGFTFLIYNSVVFLGSGLAFISEYANNKLIKKLTFLLSFFIVWLIAALRYNVGTDYPNYIYIFEYLHQYEIGKLEPLYFILNQIIFYLKLDAQWLFVITSFICIYFIYKTACYYHRGWFILFFLLFWYFASLNLVRQMTALGIMSYGFHCLLNGRHNKFFCSLIFALGFHYSVLFLLPLFFIKNIRISWLSGILILISTIVIITQFNIIQLIFSSGYFESSKYGVYAINEYNRESEIGSGIGILIQLLAPLLIVFFSHKIQLQQRYSIVVLLSIIFIATLLLTLDVYIFNRVMVVYSLCYLFIAGYISKSDFHYKNLLLLFIAIGGLAMFEKNISIALFKLNSGLGINPYQSILQFL